MAASRGDSHVADAALPSQALQDNGYRRVPDAETAVGEEQAQTPAPRRSIHGRHVLAVAVIMAVVLAAGLASRGFWGHRSARAADLEAVVKDFQIVFGEIPNRTSRRHVGKQARPRLSPSPRIRPLHRGPWTQDVAHHISSRGETYDELRRRAPTSGNLQASLALALTHGVLELNQESFRHGPFVITQPGVYKLSENVFFAPNKDNEYMPFRDTPPYTYDKGYWLGFFAAIVVAASNVLIDLNGKRISMSHEFSLAQRFFSVIELCDTPYRALDGPGVLGYAKDQIISAQGVAIYNGELGLSSHMGIHGIGNVGVWVDNVIIRDFEVGGINLNGASHVYLSNLHVGPSLGATGSSHKVPATAAFFVVQFMLRILLSSDMKWEPEFSSLQAEYHRFIADRISGRPQYRRTIFDAADGSFSGLPDGGALYGILLHETGPAAHDFTLFAAPQESRNQVRRSTFRLRNVVIENLHIETEEVVAMQWQDRYAEAPIPVTGMMGEIFQGVRAARRDGSYRGNLIVDSQLALQKLKNSEGLRGPASRVHFGNINLPQEILGWVDGASNLEDLERSGLSYACHVDTMGRPNKGAVGLRLDGISYVMLEGVTISGLKNTGARGPDHAKCPPGGSGGGTYKGTDVRGISISNVSHLLGQRVYIGHLDSQAGVAMGVEARQGDENVHFDDLRVMDLRGENGDLRNAMTYVARREKDGFSVRQD